MARRFWALAMAAGLLSSAAALSPQDIPSDFSITEILSSAQTHLSKGETSEALVYYDAAVALEPENYLTLFKRGATYLSLGRTSQATDDFNKVLGINPSFEGAHVQLAKIKSKAGDWAAARAAYTAAKRAPDSPEMVELDEAQGAARLAEEAFKAGQWEECVNHAGAAIMVASRVPALRELRSQCRFERGELEEGMSDLQHILNMRPGDTKPHLLVSATTFYGLGDLDSGITQVKKCLHSDPESKVCKKLHKQEKAVKKTLDKATAQLKRNQPTTAGRTLVGTGEDRGLLSDVEEQIAQLRADGNIPASATPRLYNTLVELVCQAYTESTHKDVAKYCQQALDLDAGSFWGRLYRGKALLKKEEFEESVRVLSELFDEARSSNQGDAEKVRALLEKAKIALKRSQTKDYYKVLGVPTDADDRQIKKAYNKASLQHHPDKAHKQGVSKEEAEKKMAAINEAYEVLKDPELRARFDRGDDPNSQEGQQGHPFQGHPFAGGFGGFGGGAGGFPFHQFQQQQGGGGQRKGGQSWQFGF